MLYNNIGRGDHFVDECYGGCSYDIYKRKQEG